MSDSDKRRIDEIKQRLQAATPGPWEFVAVDPNTLWLGGQDVTGEDGLVVHDGFITSMDRCDACVRNNRSCTWPSDANRAFMEHAWEDIKFLLEQLRLQSPEHKYDFLVVK